MGPIFDRIANLVSEHGGTDNENLPYEQRMHSVKCFYYPNARKMTSTDQAYFFTDSVPSEKLSKKGGVRKLSYQERLSFCCRKSESSELAEKFEGRIPIIVERFRTEKRLPEMKNCQFIVPKHTTVGQLQYHIRKRLGEFHNMAMYLLIAGQALPCVTAQMSELYSKYRDDDGFLYISFSSEDCYG